MVTLIFFKTVLLLLLRVSVNMAQRVEVCSQCEVRSVIRYFASEGLNGNEIHEKICARYGEGVTNIQKVRLWIKRFRDEGRTDVHHLSRSGCPSDSTTDLNNGLEEDRRMRFLSCDQLKSPNCSRSSVGRIVRNIFGIMKRSSRWKTAITDVRP